MAEISNLNEDTKLNEYFSKLNDLRKDGTAKIAELKQLISAAKKNKMLDTKEKADLLKNYSEQIVKAREIEKKNSPEDKLITKEAIAYANTLSKGYLLNVDSSQNSNIIKLKEEYKETVQKIKNEGTKRIASCKTKLDAETAKYELKSALFDAKNHAQTEIARCKDL